jgi:hypothetical protein
VTSEVTFECLGQGGDQGMSASFGRPPPNFSPWISELHILALTSTARGQTDVAFVNTYPSISREWRKVASMRSQALAVGSSGEQMGSPRL